MRADAPVLKDLVLVGGGHTHVGVLKAFGMKRMPGVRVTLIGRDVHTPYSGMLPGHVAGHYAFDDLHIDLARLCAFAGARFYHDEAAGLDLAERRVLCRGRPPVRYDVLSIDTGSAPDTASVPGAEGNVVPVKPINGFLAHWEALRERVLARAGQSTVAVVGAGAGGVEILLAVQYRLAALLREHGHDPAATAYHLLAGSGPLLSHYPERVQAGFRRTFAARGVRVHERAEVERVEPGRLHASDGTVLDADEILWVTSAGAPAWPQEAGLAVEGKGFIRVDATLRSVSHPEVFAAGDIAALPEPRPKSGVFAVREAKPLTRNLRRALLGRAPKPFRPQRVFLTILTTGGKHAVAERGGWSVEGDWVWRWKDRIDRRFMRKYADLPAMGPAGAPDLPHGLADAAALAELAAGAMRCGGCGAKVGSTVLTRALGGIAPLPRPDVLVGLASPDDAAVVAVPPGKALVQSVDHFRAMIDDPYVFAQVAANHSLGDLYAMGAEPQSALAVVTLPYGPETQVEEQLRQVMAGAAKVLAAAGATLAGGHTGEGPELALGFVVNGLADPARLMRKGGLRPGDRLILTKPLGTGVLFAAHMRLAAKGRWIDAALATMLQSSRAAAECLRAHGALACTDVTGFGLLGHLLEMTKPSGVGATLDLPALPLLDGALEVVGQGIFSSLQPQNLRLRRALRDGDAAAEDPRFALLFDPQTAGGLLAGVPADRANACVEALRALGYENAVVVGAVTTAQDVVTVRA